MGEFSLDERDRQIVAAAARSRESLTGFLVGDWVVFADGARRRIAHVWPDGVQTCAGGRFHLSDGGAMQFSGQPSPTTPQSVLEMAGWREPASAWIFHHGVLGAGRGVEVVVDVSVWRATIPAPQL